MLYLKVKVNIQFFRSEFNVTVPFTLCTIEKQQLQQKKNSLKKNHCYEEHVM